MSGNALVASQRSAAERLRREVLGIDGSLRHPYFRALTRHTREFERPADEAEILDACAEARVVYVGDFHALASCQRYAATLLRRLADRGERFSLGVEFVYTRQQPILDMRQRGALDDAGFLARIHYREEWGYEYDGYRELLDAARELRLPVHALDAPPRGGYEGLGRRDRHAARRMLGILGRDPEARLLVLFGESHLAPTHLPRQVARAARRLGTRFPAVSIFQNPDDLYWRALERGGRSGPLRIDAESFAVLHASPLEKYEAYRSVLQRWQDDTPADEEVDLTPAVHHLIGVLLEWLGIRPERHRLQHRAGWAEELADAYPEVYSGGEAPQLLEPILRDHGRTLEEIAEARTALASRGAVYDPRSNAMFLVRYLPGRAAGEAARFLRTALTRRLFLAESDFDDPADRAYGAAYNEALAFVAARLVDPAADRVPPFDAPWHGAAATAGGSPPLRTSEQADWLRDHVAFERETRRVRPPASLLDPLRASRRLRRLLALDLGQRLGRGLFEKVRTGELAPRRLRRLFARPLRPNQVPSVLIRLLREVV